VRLWSAGLCQQIYLGDEQFVERMQALPEPQRRSAHEIPKTQRRKARSLDHWLASCDGREVALRKAKHGRRYAYERHRP